MKGKYLPASRRLSTSRVALENIFKIPTEIRSRLHNNGSKERADTTAVGLLSSLLTQAKYSPLEVYRLDERDDIRIMVPCSATLGGLEIFADRDERGHEYIALQFFRDVALPVQRIFVQRIISLRIEKKKKKNQRFL